MRGDADTLIAERDRIESELTKLEKRQADLEKERAEITLKSETATGNTETLAQLKIETEQVAEAKRQNDRLIDQTTKRYKELESTILMLKQSDIV